MPALVTEVSRKHCVLCEGGVPAVTPNQMYAFLNAIPRWTLVADGKRICREWRMKDFKTALDFV